MPRATLGASFLRSYSATMAQTTLRFFGSPALSPSPSTSPFPGLGLFQRARLVGSRLISFVDNLREYAEFLI